MDRAPFTGIVLTGGRSRRMGRDKALLDPGDGGPVLAARARAALTAAGAARCLAVGGDRPALAALGFDAVPDDPGLAGEGPLAALVGAVAHVEHDPVVVLSCDLPAITAEVIGELVDRLRAGGADAVVPVVGGRRQVLAAAYRRSLAPHLAAQVAAGERSLSRALAGVVVEEWTEVDGWLLVDLDRPEDLDHYARRTDPSNPTGDPTT